MLTIKLNDLRILFHTLQYLLLHTLNYSKSLRRILNSGESNISPLTEDIKINSKAMCKFKSNSFQANRQTINKATRKVFNP